MVRDFVDTSAARNNSRLVSKELPSLRPARWRAVPAMLERVSADS
jgi:hypothetical protein